MGIPSYFKKIHDDCPEVIIKNIDSSINNFLFLDLNCAIHPCCRKASDGYKKSANDYCETKMINSVLNYIEKLVNIVNPSLLYIAIDGVAPLAKMRQQRLRRFKNIIDKKNELDLKKRLNMVTEDEEYWDTNAISPGTQFMNKLDASIKSFIDSNNTLRAIEVIFNPCSVQGEGEHKIMNFIKKNKDSLNGNIVIYGLDADLIMLSMTCRKDNIYLLREEIEFNVKGKTTQDSFGDHFLYLDIDRLKRELIRDIHSKYNVIDNTYILKNINNTSPASIKNGNFIDDYIFLCFLLGNDFVPHSVSISLKNKGHDILIEKYIITHYKLNEHFIVNNKINHQFLMYLIRLLSEIEDSILLNFSKKRQRFNINHMNFDNDYEKEKELLNNYPILNQENEKYIDIGTRGWRDRFYYKTLDIIDKNEVFEICAEYIKILKWTFDYYFKECSTFNYCYNYDEAPSMLDLYRYMKANERVLNINNICFKKGLMYSSLVQLMYILPKNSIESIFPTEIVKLTNSDSNIGYYYPIDFKLNDYYKRFYWQCTPILPVIDFDLLKKTISELNLSSKIKKQFTRGKVYGRKSLIN
tara:strand:- start:23058 stop:24803 length:1746 start_codon:yes stop_codon:yes gene_type:complete